MAIRTYTKIFSIFSIVLVPLVIKTTTKNTCDNYLDYFLINFSDKCYYNPDVYLSVPQLVEKYTPEGNFRSYTITTEDGYILTVFRIFHKNPKGVILLQPPISAGSIAWLSDGNESLAFTLWNKGYDVWLTNHRGSTYSRKHKSLTDSDSKYWDYSFNEIALYDFDVQFNLIRNETNGSKVIYVGYSMSATTPLIYASIKPEEAQKYVESFILIAPTSVLNHFVSPFKYIFYVLKPFEKFLRMGEFPTMELVRWIADYLTVAPYMANLISSTVMGWTPTEFDPTLYPYIFPHHGRGITNKMIYHYSQIFSMDNKFSMYDYGKETNRVFYGSDIPPDYPLEKIQTPIHIIYGEKDALAAPLDVEYLSNTLLPKEIVKNKIFIHHYNHIDYMFSKNRRKKTYKHIYEIVDKIR